MSNSLPDKELFVECPQCKKDIKQKNLKRHLRKIHGEKIAPIQPTSFQKRQVPAEQHLEQSV